jgi:hypothetical protein
MMLEEAVVAAFKVVLEEIKKNLRPVEILTGHVSKAREKPSRVRLLAR